MRILASTVLFGLLLFSTAVATYTPRSCRCSSVKSCTNAIKHTKTRTRSLTSWCSSVLGCVKSTTTISGDPVTVRSTKTKVIPYTQTVIVDLTETSTIPFTITTDVLVATVTVSPTIVVEKFVVTTVLPHVPRNNRAGADGLLERRRACTTSICPSKIQKQACACLITRCAPPVTKHVRKTITLKVTETSSSLIEQSLTETDTYYLLDYHTVTHDYSSTIESGILSTHTTTIECTPGSTNPSFYLQATNAPDIDEQYYWAKGSTPRIIPDAVDAKFTPDISDATVFTLDSDKRLVTVRDGGPLYADVDYFGYFEIVHLMSEADIALRDWNYLRCDVRPPSGRYPGDYGELYCLADGAFNRDVWNYCPEYFDSYNTGLVLGNYWSESSPDCFNVTFLVKPVCES